jgi:hypothetical protein
MYLEVEMMIYCPICKNEENKLKDYWDGCGHSMKMVFEYANGLFERIKVGISILKRHPINVDIYNYDGTFSNLSFDVSYADINEAIEKLEGKE